MFDKLNISPKAKKIINIVVDVIVGLVLVFAFFLAVCTISSKAKGYQDYTEVFGKAYLAVSSESMEKDAESGEVRSDNFSVGDMITIKLVSEEQAKDLEVGKIITFKDPYIIDGKRVLNTHRIIEIAYNTDGSIKHFVTHGDNNPKNITEWVLPSEVVGVYQGKASGIGHMFLFMSTSTGFFVCIVLPTLIVVLFAAVNLVLVILKEKKVQATASEDAKQAEREKLRAELLAEMGMPAETKAETKEEQPEVQEEQPEEPEQENESEQEEASDGAGDNE